MTYRDVRILIGYSRKYTNYNNNKAIAEIQ